MSQEEKTLMEDKEHSWNSYEKYVIAGLRRLDQSIIESNACVLEKFKQSAWTIGIAIVFLSSFLWDFVKHKLGFN